MNKQPQVTDATRQALVNAFFQLAKKKSIYKITVREITELAGYNRTTFYRYFEDVFALIEYAEDDFLNKTRQLMGEQMQNGQFGERGFFEVIIRCCHENKEQVAILLSEQNRSHFLRRIKESLTNSVYGQNGATHKKQVVMDIYFYGIFYAISINLQSKNALSDEDLLDIIQKLFDSWYLPQMRENSKGDTA